MSQMNQKFDVVQINVFCQATLEGDDDDERKPVNTSTVASINKTDIKVSTSR